MIVLEAASELSLGLELHGTSYSSFFGNCRNACKGPHKKLVKLGRYPSSLIPSSICDRKESPLLLLPSKLREHRKEYPLQRPESVRFRGHSSRQTTWFAYIIFLQLDAVN